MKKRILAWVLIVILMLSTTISFGGTREDDVPKVFSIQSIRYNNSLY